MKFLSNLSKLSYLLIALLIFSGCDKDDPEEENTPELITKVNLIFTPAGGGNAVIVSANDPDGEGPADLVVEGPINLSTGVSYTLTMELINGLLDPSDDEYFIHEEVEEEADEHMFFFGWTGNVFSNPTGNGNIANRAGLVNYLDQDANNLPLGLETSWTAATNAANGTFRVVLKHQPDIKTATSTAQDGESDMDVTFTINIQ